MLAQLGELLAESPHVAPAGHPPVAHDSLGIYYAHFLLFRQVIQFET
ncbi:MAG: hypothetical protein GXY55_12935 [Phycisphaerae bacterium]|nr:hypothetical protein [Phycisphaerae bacterium]